MSWFKKDKEVPAVEEEEMSTAEMIEEMETPQVEHKMIALIDIYRNFAYDAGFRDPEERVRRFAPSLYSPVSPEGIEKIQEDSNARCDVLTPITHVLHAQAMFGAISFAEIWCEHQGLSDDQREEMLDIVVPFAHVMLMGSLAGLQEYLGDLHVASAGVVDGE